MITDLFFYDFKACEIICKQKRLDLELNGHTFLCLRANCNQLCIRYRNSSCGKTQLLYHYHITISLVLLVSTISVKSIVTEGKFFLRWHWFTIPVNFCVQQTEIWMTNSEVSQLFALADILLCAQLVPG